MQAAVTTGDEAGSGNFQQKIICDQIPAKPPNLFCKAKRFALRSLLDPHSFSEGGGEGWASEKQFVIRLVFRVSKIRVPSFGGFLFIK